MSTATAVPSIIQVGSRAIDLFHDLLTTSEAAELAGVTPETVRHWASRGILTAAARDRNGRPRYVPIDVAKAEAKTRRRTFC